MDPLALMDAPFTVVHEYHRLSFLAAQAQKEKEDEEKKQHEEEERKRKQEEQRQRQAELRRNGPMVSPLPVKQSSKQVPSTPTTNRTGHQILANAQMGEVEDILEEGF